MRNSPYIRFHTPSIGEEEIQKSKLRCARGGLPPSAHRSVWKRNSPPSSCAMVGGSELCTAGLHVALAAPRNRQGDEVITTPLTFCRHCTHHTSHGSEAVLADIGPDGNIDPEEIARDYPAHARHYAGALAGLPCDMSAIWRSPEHGLFVNRRRPHAAGAHYHVIHRTATGKTSEGASDGWLQLLRHKNMSTGEGGW